MKIQCVQSYLLSIIYQSICLISRWSNHDVNEILEHGSSKKTTLTEYFVGNSKYPAARDITYQEFLQHFTLNKTAKKWTSRKWSFAIGRIYFASPSAGEQFYLHTLLTVVKGAQSFEELHTVGGHLHVTFKTA
jgi:hypothetical protein